MRVFLLSGCLLVSACGSQPTPVIADYERPPAKVSSAWECDPRSAGLWNCSAAREPAAPAPSPPEDAAPAERNEVSAGDDGYVLQVGAFRRQELAVKASRQIGLPALTVVPTRRGEEDWYVLLLGTYPSALDAREAGEAYLDANPRGAIWVRAAADLRESRIVH
jgi:septal ring-binding cell division protein DamX